MSDNTISTLLVEDHEIALLGLKKMLEKIKQIQIVAETNSGVDAVRLATELRPDLILMDIGLPDMNGIEATRLIKASIPCKILLITSRDGEEDVMAGVAAGADAYCLKDISASRLSSAIHSILEGAFWLDPEIAKTFKQGIPLKPKDKEAAPQDKRSRAREFQLSDREFEILCLLVEGLSNQQMAERLFLSTETVKTHMRHLMEKLRVSDRTQAAVKAVKEGIVPGGGTQKQNS
jgi:DNA-binding NarL/FixJ family response regulator